MHPVAEIALKLAISALVALAIWLLDGPLAGVELAWWLCAIIALVLVFGGWLIIIKIDDT